MNTPPAMLPMPGLPTVIVLQQKDHGTNPGVGQLCDGWNGSLGEWFGGKVVAVNLHNLGRA